MGALGETFRTARESQGLTLADVADRIHIRSIYLAAIEAEDWIAIGPPVYIRGFVRTYARFLGLDPDAAVAVFSANPPTAGVAAPAEHTAQIIGEASPSYRSDAPRRRPSLGAIAGAAVALALVAFVGYEYVDYARHEAAPATAGSAARARTQPAGPARAAPPVSAEPAADLHSAVKGDARASGFTVRLQDASWVRVVVDGKVAMEGIYPKGTERAFGGRSATVRVGNAGGVDIWVDGKDLGPMGGLGDVAERSFQL